MIIKNGRQGSEVIDDAMKALIGANNPPDVFLRNGQIVRIITDEREQSLIAPLTIYALREKLGRVANWVVHKKETKEGKAAKDVYIDGWAPKEVAESILTLPLASEFPPLQGLSAVPVCSSSGEFTTDYGYDPRSRWFVTERGKWPTWEGTPQEAAHWILNELVSDFPFETQASRANALALTVTFFIRSLIRGPIPMFFFDAPDSGTGKTLCAQLCMYPAIGRWAAVSSAPSAEPEMEKFLYSMLLQGDDVIFFDNQKGVLNSKSLEACLTATAFKSRVLSFSQAKEAPITAIFVLTANLGKLSRDAVRRCAWIRLNANVETPSARTGWKHEKIDEWAVENRKTLVSAVIAMVTGWVAAGMPQGDKKKATYEDWSAKVGGVLKFCGVPGFLENDVDLLESANEEYELWAPFFEMWRDRFGFEPVTTKELTAMTQEHDLIPFVFERCRYPSGFSTALGKALNGRVDRVLGGLQLKKHTMQKGFTRFKLVLCGGVVDFTSKEAQENLVSLVDNSLLSSEDLNVQSSPLHHVGSNPPKSGGLEFWDFHNPDDDDYEEYQDYEDDSDN